MPVEGFEGCVDWLVLGWRSGWGSRASSRWGVEVLGVDGGGCGGLWGLSVEDLMRKV